MFRTPIKVWNVIPEGDFYSGRVASTALGIIGREGSPKPGSLDANDGIDCRIEIFAAPENLDADVIALNMLVLATERRFHKEPKKGDKLWRAAKFGTRNDILQRGANLFRRKSIIPAFHSSH